MCPENGLHATFSRMSRLNTDSSEKRWKAGTLALLTNLPPYQPRTRTAVPDPLRGRRLNIPRVGASAKEIRDELLHVVRVVRGGVPLTHQNDRLVEGGAGNDVAAIVLRNS
jgi:hypothetical protein